MKILFILPWVPYPLDSGGNQAFFNMLDRIRQNHEVTLIACTHSSKDRQAADALQQVWPNVRVLCFSDKEVTTGGLTLTSKESVLLKVYSSIERSVGRKKARLIRRAMNRGEGEGFSLGRYVKQHSTLFKASTYVTPDFMHYVYEKSREGYDMIQVEFYELLPLVYVLPEDVRKVFVHHELRFVRNENEVSLFDRVTMDEKVLFARQKDEEMAALRRYDDVIVLTQTDKEILSHYLPEQTLYVSPALTNASKVAGRMQFHPGKDLVFLGGGGHFPNADGLMWFAKEVSPSLLKGGFTGHIYVVGKWDDSTRAQVHQFCPVIEFTGFIDDLYAFLNGKLTIVPIRIGSGMRMKILDSMVACSPMVTTGKGCEGLPYTHEVDCLIADRAEDFATCILRLWRDEALQQTLAEHSVAKMLSVLDADALLNQRLAFYQ